MRAGSMASSCGCGQHIKLHELCEETGEGEGMTWTRLSECVFSFLPLSSLSPSSFCLGWVGFYLGGGAWDHDLLLSTTTGEERERGQFGNQPGGQEASRSRQYVYPLMMTTRWMDWVWGFGGFGFWVQRLGFIGSLARSVFVGYLLGVSHIFQGGTLPSLGGIM